MAALPDSTWASQNTGLALRPCPSHQPGYPGQPKPGMKTPRPPSPIAIMSLGTRTRESGTGICASLSSQFNPKPRVGLVPRRSVPQPSYAYPNSAAPSGRAKSPAGNHLCTSGIATTQSFPPDSPRRRPEVQSSLGGSARHPSVGDFHSLPSMRGSSSLGHLRNTAREKQRFEVNAFVSVITLVPVELLMMRVPRTD